MTTTELSKSEHKSLKRARTKPQLVTIGDKQVVSNGRWDDDCIIIYIIANPGRWISVPEIAKVAYWSNSVANKKKVRKHLSVLFDKCLERDEVLVVEYEGSRAKHLKLYEGGSEVENQHTDLKLAKMENAATINGERRRKAIDLLVKKGALRRTKGEEAA